MSDTKSKALDTDLVIEALDDIQAEQRDHGHILVQLQARPIPDLAGVERRLDEYADALERLRPQPKEARWRPWWLTPGLVTLGVLVGIGVGWVSLAWMPRWVRPVVGIETPAKGTPVPQVPAGKKGK